MFNKIITNKKELYEYINSVNFEDYRDTEFSSVYFLVNDKGIIAPIYFFPYENFYFESPCYLIKTMPESEVEEYVRETYENEYIEKAIEYEKGMCRNGYHYEIDCPQCSPFLSTSIEIISILTEAQCLDWLLSQKGE